MLGAPSSRAMEKLFAAIDAEEASATRAAVVVGVAGPQVRRKPFANPQRG
jgi:hypothetical protein